MYQKRLLFKNSNWNVDENIVCDTNIIICLVFSLPIWMSGKSNKLLNKVHDRFWWLLVTGFIRPTFLRFLQMLKSLKLKILLLTKHSFLSWDFIILVRFLPKTLFLAKFEDIILLSRFQDCSMKNNS